MNQGKRRTKNHSGTIALVVIAAVAVLLCICTSCIVGGAVLFATRSEIQADPAPLVATSPTPIPTPISIPTTESFPPETQETLETISTSEIPEADLHELGIRFLGVSPDIPRVASTTNPDYPIGTMKPFMASNLDAD